jgi:hypothetical protein
MHFPLTAGHSGFGRIVASGPQPLVSTSSVLPSGLTEVVSAWPTV